MPEGDTVWLAAHRLHDALAGSVITGCDFRWPSLATASVAGTEVLVVAPRGKHLLVRFGDGRTLHTHFRMQGSWHLYRPGANWSGGPAHQIRAVLRTEDWVAVGYRLAVMDMIRTADESTVVGHLGPDILGPDWDLDRAVANVHRRPQRAIGMALLDQRNLAGIGNIYRTEALFLCRTHLATPVAEVADLAAVLTQAKRLMERNKARASQSTTGEEGFGRTHYVYQRAGRPCRRCGSRIAMADQPDPPDPTSAGDRTSSGNSDRSRIAYWCPTCQPQP